MDNVYGVLDLSAKTLTVIVIAAWLTLMIAILLYLYGRTLTGAIVHLVSFTLAAVVIASWLTSITDWNSGEAFGAIVGSSAMLLCWLVAGGLMFLASLEKSRTPFRR